MNILYDYKLKGGIKKSLADFDTWIEITSLDLLTDMMDPSFEIVLPE